MLYGWCSLLPWHHPSRYLDGSQIARRWLDIARRHNPARMCCWLAHWLAHLPLWHQHSLCHLDRLMTPPSKSPSFLRFAFAFIYIHNTYYVCCLCVCYRNTNINMHCTILKGDDASNNLCGVILQIFPSYIPVASFLVPSWIASSSKLFSTRSLLWEVVQLSS